MNNSYDNNNKMNEYLYSLKKNFETLEERLLECEANLKVYQGTARHAFGTYEMIASLGATFPVGSR
jgi:hypothetical protein